MPTSNEPTQALLGFRQKQPRPIADIVRFTISRLTAAESALEPPSAAGRFSLSNTEADMPKRIIDKKTRVTGTAREKAARMRENKEASRGSKDQDETKGR